MESDYIHNKLKPWLDMLFGCKQKNKSAKNIFFCFAYEVIFI